MNELIFESIPNQQRANELLSKLFDITQPSAVFSEPVTKGEYTVITASELQAGVGTGYGGGGDFHTKSAEGDVDAANNEALDNNSVSTGGGGGGGGGASSARPIAAIIIGPNGVRVEPIVDATKIAITFFTAVGGMIMAFGRMQKSK